MSGQPTCHLRMKSQPAAPLSPALSPSAVKLRLLKKLRCTLRYEKKAWAAGARLVAGVDEVGRGSLFGCVVAAAVILDPRYRVRGVRDSKLLPPERREVLAERIREHAVAWAVAAGDAGSGDAPGACGGPLAGRRYASRLRAAANAYHSWRRSLGFDCGRVDPREGGTRPHHVRVGWCVSWLRARFA